MAWRPSEWVIDGELDNTTPGWTVGWVRFRDREEPLQLKLAGNCHPDLAGWKFRIVRTDPIPEWVETMKDVGIRTDQSGNIGDVTADQMLQHFECSTDEFVERCYAGDRPPTTLRKSLYLEWFSRNNGRIVIQSTRLAVERIGDRTFELTDEEWVEQSKQNAEEMSFFMTQLGDALSDMDDNPDQHDADEIDT